METSRLALRLGIWPAWTLAPLVAALLLVGPGSRPALACSCEAPADEGSFQRADAVFRDEVVHYEPPRPERALVSKLSRPPGRSPSARSTKGDVHARQEIVSAAGGDICGLEISRSGEFLVFAHRKSFDIEVSEDQYYAGLCGGPAPFREVPLPCP